MTLTNEKCVACRRDSPRVTQEEIAELLPQIPGWDLTQERGIDIVQRTFPFPDFAAAVAFTAKVAELAEEEGHHPRLILEWGQVAVAWWTHKIRGLHRNDFIMAAKTDAIHTQTDLP